MNIKKRVMCAVLAFVLCFSALSISALPLSAESESTVISTFGVAAETIDLTAFEGIENYIGQEQYPYWALFKYTWDLGGSNYEVLSFICADEPIWALGLPTLSWNNTLYFQVSSRVPAISPTPSIGLTWQRDVGETEWTFVSNEGSWAMHDERWIDWGISSVSIPYYDRQNDVWPGDYLFDATRAFLLLPNTPDPYPLGIYWWGTGKPASDDIYLRNASATPYRLIMRDENDRHWLVESFDPIEVRYFGLDNVVFTTNALSDDSFYYAYIWDLERNDSGSFSAVGDYTRGVFTGMASVVEYWTPIDIPVCIVGHDTGDYNENPFWFASTGQILVSDVPEEPEEPDDGGFWPWWKEQWLNFRTWLSDGFDRIVEAIQSIGKNSSEEDETSFFDVVKMCIDAIKSLITGFFGFVVKGILELIKGTFGDMFEAFNSFSVGDWL